MSNTVFTTVSTNRLISQPVTACKIYIRSTDAADGMNSDIYGTVSGLPDTEFVQVEGLSESETALVFSTISQYILDSSPVGVVTGYAPGVAATGDIRIDSNPSDGDTIDIGFSTTYRFKNTLAAIRDVKIGATMTDTLLSLKRAINADGTAGVDYYVGTNANNTYSGTVATNVITLTDRIPCNRQIPRTLGESAANFSLRNPIGGVDGTILFTISPGVTAAADPLTFSSEDHTTTTLPALMLGTSPAINVQGNQAMLRLWSDNTIDYKIQSSTDQINWVDTSEGTETLAASALTNVLLAELHEFIRFVIVANANTDDTIADFRVIY